MLGIREFLNFWNFGNFPTFEDKKILELWKFPH